MLVTFRYCENTSIGLWYSRRSIFSALVESLWNCTQIPQIHSKYTPSKKCTRVRAAHPEDWETRQVGQTAFRIRVQDKQTSQNFECLQSRLQLLFTLHRGALLRRIITNWPPLMSVYNGEGRKNDHLVQLFSIFRKNLGKAKERVLKNPLEGERSSVLGKDFKKWFLWCPMYTWPCPPQNIYVL